jgi:hypothetical protein
MTDDAPTGEEFAAWMTPGDALARLSEILRSQHRTAAALVERLKGGMIKSAARSSSWEGRNGTQEEQRIVLIPAHYWLELQSPNGAELIWQTGDVRFFLARRLAATHPNLVGVRYYGVRFDPVGVKAWLADLPAPVRHKWTRPKPEPEPSVPSPVPATDEAGASKEPPVSEDLLRDWYVLYRKAYTGAQDTEDNALKSALGTFPGKSVTRKRIRNLRGTQKVGRKPRDPEA